jgi:Flp pilus assembly pilin Flp
VSIAVELPFAGTVEPRVLECAASILRVRAFSKSVRIVAEIQRMSVMKRETATHTRSRSATHSCTADIVPAITRSQTTDPVIFANHPNNSNSEGEHTMSFLKNFFVEEEGQDMVEYGLVIALVVIGAAAGYTAFQVQITGALTTLGTAIGAKL